MTESSLREVTAGLGSICRKVATRSCGCIAVSRLLMSVRCWFGPSEALMRAVTLPDKRGDVCEAEKPLRAAIHLSVFAIR